VLCGQEQKRRREKGKRSSHEFPTIPLTAESPEFHRKRSIALSIYEAYDRRETVTLNDFTAELELKR